VGDGDGDGGVEDLNGIELVAGQGIGGRSLIARSEDDVDPAGESNRPSRACRRVAATDTRAFCGAALCGPQAASRAARTGVRIWEGVIIACTAP